LSSGGSSFFVGTSGYAFKEWKGNFYPPELSDREWLSFYGARLPAVEINNTFYRMPREQTLVEWAAQVPPAFRFALKATQRITHHAQLKNVGDLLGYLVQTSLALGDRLGPTLFQLPPHLKKDLPRLVDFLALLPKRWKATVEFRHPSWFEDDVFQALSGSGVALCVSDQDQLSTPLVSTAEWGYLRLHRMGYNPAAVGEWAERIRAQPWTETYVFFKHDHGPESGWPVAESLLTALRA
jgi:uncharacterized protein YecE (DUF72 family)